MAVLLIITILIGMIVTAVASKKSDDEWIEVLKLPKDHQTGMQYVRTSTKSWADRAWLGGVDPEKITSINFIANYNKGAATKAWIFDGLSVYFKNGSVYMVVGNGLKVTGSMNGAFSELTQLTEISGLELLDTSEVTDMSNLFKNCKSLITLPIKSLKTEGVVLAESMFQGCEMLSDLDMSEMNMKNAIDMDKIFAQCYSLNSLYLPQTRDVMSLSGAFEEVGRWSDYMTYAYGAFDTHACEDMSYMFRNACLYDYDFVQKFNTASLKNAEGMFYDCSVECIDLSGWDTSNIKTTKKMFWSDMHMRMCNMDGWNVQSLENCEYMFYLCTSMKSIELKWNNVPNIQDAAYLFANCFHVESLDISCFDGMLIGNAKGMFIGCESVVSIYGGSIQADVTDDMFIGCYELVGAVAYSEDCVDGQMANLNGYFSR